MDGDGGDMGSADGDDWHRHGCTPRPSARGQRPTLSRRATVAAPPPTRARPSPGALAAKKASGSATVPSPAVGALLLLLCGPAAALPRAATFFLPLVASTSHCCAAACLCAVAERGATKDAAVEVVLKDGEDKAEAGPLQVIGEANASAYGDGLGGGGIQMGCFIRRSAKRGVHEDGEEVVFTGTLGPASSSRGAAGEGTAMPRLPVGEEKLYMAASVVE